MMGTHKQQSPFPTLYQLWQTGEGEWASTHHSISKS
jgi:hypothetical protein